jgi:hypothetical protein
MLAASGYALRRQRQALQPVRFLTVPDDVFLMRDGSVDRVGTKPRVEN